MLEKLLSIIPIVGKLMGLPIAGSGVKAWGWRFGMQLLGVVHLPHAYVKLRCIVETNSPLIWSLFQVPTTGVAAYV